MGFFNIKCQVPSWCQNSYIAFKKRSRLHSFALMLLVQFCSISHAMHFYLQNLSHNYNTEHTDEHYKRKSVIFIWDISRQSLKSSPVHWGFSKHKSGCPPFQHCHRQSVVRAGWAGQRIPPRAQWGRRCGSHPRVPPSAPPWPLAHPPGPAQASAVACWCRPRRRRSRPCEPRPGGSVPTQKPSSKPGILGSETTSAAPFHRGWNPQCSWAEALQFESLASGAGGKEWRGRIIKAINMLTVWGVLLNVKLSDLTNLIFKFNSEVHWPCQSHWPSRIFTGHFLVFLY